MQPRQRSKCWATVAFSAIVPSSRASMRWMRPRGESISSLQSTYVGHVGRQNPQWTQSDVYSRIMRRAPRAGRARARIRLDELLDRGVEALLVTNCHVASSVVYADACGRAKSPRPFSASSTARPARRVRSGHVRARQPCRSPRLVPDGHVCLRRRRRAAGGVAAVPPPRESDPSKSTATRPGWRTSRALGCNCEPRRASNDRCRIVRLDDERSATPSATGAAGSSRAR